MKIVVTCIGSNSRNDQHTFDRLAVMCGCKIDKGEDTRSITQSLEGDGGQTLVKWLKRYKYSQYHRTIIRAHIFTILTPYRQPTTLKNEHWHRRQSHEQEGLL
jgi:hypothetical protein